MFGGELKAVWARSGAVTAKRLNSPVALSNTKITAAIAMTDRSTNILASRWITMNSG
jgi:hypothetical protein